MRTVPWTFAAVVAAALTAAAPTLLLQARDVMAHAAVAVSWQPESAPPQAPPAAQEPSADEPSGDDADAPGAGDQREARVVTANGDIFTGLLVEHNQDRVVLKINGITAPFPVKDITSIETLPPNRERYEQYRAALDPADVRGRLNLVKWLVSVDMLDEAKIETDHAVKIDPSDVPAAEQRLLVEGLINLRRNEKNPASKGPGKRPPGGAKPKPPPFPLLTPEQINTIRVYEINLADPPRLQIDRDTVTQLIQQFAGDPLIPANREAQDALYRKRPEQIVDLMFKLRARDFYPRVKVLQDPASMRKFREDVHRGWLLNYCASNDCHGGTQAGRLWLNNRPSNSDGTVYTNFYILDRFRIRAERGDQKGQLVPLIDFVNPAQSPLIQLALPPGESLFPHPTPQRPGKAPYKPLFRDVDDARVERTVRWIESMYIPRPEYGISYTPPNPAKEVAAQKPPADPPDAPSPPAEER
jgi:hypothetical protein